MALQYQLPKKVCYNLYIHVFVHTFTNAGSICVDLLASSRARSYFDNIMYAAALLP